MEFTYNPAYVALSIAIAIFGSFTGLIMTSGIRRIHGFEYVLRIVLGALGIGGGIWSMHFVAMLAVVLPIELSYDIDLTVVSASLAVAFVAIAFAIVSGRRFGKYTLPVSALFLGSGIASMHYIGMAAVRGNCELAYSSIGVVISIFFAVQASAVALWFAFRERGVIDTFLGAIALGLAIASMHYSAMQGTRFLPAEAQGDIVGSVISDQYLALSISIMIYSICILCIIVFIVLTFARRAIHRRSNQRHTLKMR